MRVQRALMFVQQQKKYLNEEILPAAQKEFDITQIELAQKREEKKVQKRLLQGYLNFISKSFHRAA